MIQDSLISQKLFMKTYIFYILMLRIFLFSLRAVSSLLTEGEKTLEIFINLLYLDPALLPMYPQSRVSLHAIVDVILVSIPGTQHLFSLPGMERSGISDRILHVQLKCYLCTVL